MYRIKIQLHDHVNDSQPEWNECVSISDEFELKFPELSRAGKVASRAELGQLNFRAETKLTLCTSIKAKFYHMLRTT